jgi:hypothetical protein
MIRGSDRRLAGSRKSPPVLKWIEKEKQPEPLQGRLAASQLLAIGNILYEGFRDLTMSSCKFFFFVCGRRQCNVARIILLFYARVALDSWHQTIA